MTAAAGLPGDGLLAAKGRAAPLTRPPAGARVEGAPPPVRPRKAASAKILVLATDRYNARLYHDLLEAGGYDAAVPKGVDRWVEALRDWAPDLALIDPGPVGRTAMDTARAILRGPDFRCLPLIVIADASDPGAAASFLGDCAGRIVKPISLPAFFAPIEAALRPQPTTTSMTAGLPPLTASSPRRSASGRASGSSTHSP